MTHESRFTHELDVCTDCVLLLANGDTSTISGAYWCEETMCVQAWRAYGDVCQHATDAFLAAQEANWPSSEWFVALGSVECEHCGDTTEDCEPWFSHRSCDLCGCRLGGDRQHAVASPRTLSALGVKDDAGVVRMLLELDNERRQLEIERGDLWALSLAQDELLEEISSIVARSEEYGAEAVVRAIWETLNDEPAYRVGGVVPFASPLDSALFALGVTQ